MKEERSSTAIAQSIRTLATGLGSLLLTLSPAHGEVNPVTVCASKTSVWTGECFPFYIELRARGSFGGAATFSLPQIPKTTVLKIGSPVISSETLDGETWFVQRHEFALFSQHTGPLEIPSFPVRFGARNGFTGPVVEVNAKTPPLPLTIKRPPGSDDIPFLITTGALTVMETWDPTPGPAEMGSIFKRTITQRAPEMTGMALAPASAQVPEGIRLYPGSPEVNDQTERGDFLGERRETLTYLIEKPGTLVMPEFIFTWWNPETARLETKTLPAVIFEVPEPPATLKESTASASSLIAGLVSVLLFGTAIRCRQQIAEWGRRIWLKLDPPDRAAARQLLRACRHNDASAASRAWSLWQTHEAHPPSADVRRAVVDMQRCTYGRDSSCPWKGHPLASAFRSHLKLRRIGQSKISQVTLPSLNPNRIP